MKNTASAEEFRGKMVIYYSHAGKIFRMPTGIPAKDKDILENKKILDEKEANMAAICREFFSINNAYPSVDYVKSKLNFINNKRDDAESLFNLFLESKDKKNIRHTKTLLHSLKRYEKEVKKIDINEMDEPFVFRFQDLLFEKVGDKTNSGLMDLLRCYLEFLQNGHIIKKFDINWKKVRERISPNEDIDRETYSFEELKFLVSKRGDVKLPKKFKNTLDRVIFQCLTGLRISDLYRLNKTHIKGHRIFITTKKTKTPVVIDLNSTSMNILESNGFQFKGDTRRYDEKIKDMLELLSDEMPSFADIVMKTTHINKIEHSIPVERYKQFASHSGRRTFITLSLDAGIPIPRIMLATGHKKMDVFANYINKREYLKKNYALDMKLGDEDKNLMEEDIYLSVNYTKNLEFSKS